jgi:transcriptional regulator with GAF, ATPase, and Fis domain
VPSTALKIDVRALIGNATPMQGVLRQITKSAARPFPVLILGESGTGKELIARSIHAESQRANFVVIDCSSLVGTLAESELFGHVKGAFTGAATSKAGLPRPD